MAYLVEISSRAQRNLARIYRSIDADESDTAFGWYRGFRQAILSLENQPNRYPQTPGNAGFRHLLYGNKPHVYRAIYRVMEKRRVVEVLHIRHGARRGFTKSDIA